MSNPQENPRVWTTDDVRRVFSALRSIIAAPQLATPLRELVADCEIGEVGAILLCASVADRLNNASAAALPAGGDPELALGSAWDQLIALRPEARGIACVLAMESGTTAIVAGSFDALGALRGLEGIANRIGGSLEFEDDGETRGIN